MNNLELVLAMRLAAKEHTGEPVSALLLMAADRLMLTGSYKQVARNHGISVQMLSKRLAKGLSLEDAVNPKLMKQGRPQKIQQELFTHATLANCK